MEFTSSEQAELVLPMVSAWSPASARVSSVSRALLIVLMFFFLSTIACLSFRFPIRDVILGLSTAFLPFAFTSLVLLRVELFSFLFESLDPESEELLAVVDSFVEWSLG